MTGPGGAPPERERIVFAWWPVRCTNGRRVWWRDVVLSERCEPDEGGWSAGVWRVVRCVPLDDLLDGTRLAS